MKIREWLNGACADLANSTTPRLDAELLLAKVIGFGRAEVLVSLNKELGASEQNLLQALIAERKQGKPMAYILAKQSFADFEVTVTPDVLIPRPTTEMIVDATIEIAKDIQAKVIYEIGTGSGAMAIALARALPTVRVIASDISDKALTVAANNVKTFNLTGRIQLVQADLSEKIEHAQLLVANLPYLPAGLDVSNDVRHEPALALWSGWDGLDHYRRLLARANFDWAVFEIGADQYKAMAELAAHLDKNIQPIHDIDNQIVGVIVSPNP